DPKGLPELGAELGNWENVSEKERIEVEKQERIDLYAALNQRVEEQVEWSKNHQGSWDLDLPATTLLQRSDDQEWEIFKTCAPAHDTDVISQHYCRFIYVDLHLFPMQYTSGSESTDKVTTVRFSPRDARLGFSKDPKKKLCGNELWH